MADDPDVTPPAPPDATSASAAGSDRRSGLGLGEAGESPAASSIWCPSCAQNPYRLAPGPRPFLNSAVTFSPGVRTSRSRRLVRVPHRLQPELVARLRGIARAHNPGQSVHAVINSLTAVVRHPWSGRFQPFSPAATAWSWSCRAETVNAGAGHQECLDLRRWPRAATSAVISRSAPDMQQATVFGRQQGHDGV